MAVVMQMHWDGVTPDQYEAVREKVNWESDVPPGAQLHVARFSNGGMEVTDVWDSAEDFQRFTDERLMPAVQEIGVGGEPDVTIAPLHNLFAPKYEGARA